MVHSENQQNAPSGDSSAYQAKRLPYGWDKSTVYEREGSGNVTDKTVKIEEARPAGFGVRQQRKPSKNGTPVKKQQQVKPPESTLGNTKYTKM